MQQFRAGKGYSTVEAIPDKGLYLRALAALRGPADEQRLLQLLQPVPKQLGQDAEAVQSGYREYQELTLSRRGLKRLYAVTLTLTLLLALLSAAALAFVLSDRLSAPIGALVEGTRAVASGDFSQRAAVASRDEIGMLTQSFNSMTLQLAEARALAERHQAALAQAKAYLESLLANLSAGVLAFDEELHLRAANPSAGAILGIDFAPLLGTAAARWPAPAPGVAELGQQIAIEFARGANGEWERQVERPQQGRTQLLLLRGTRLPGGSEGGSVVVFDDITHLAEAQRAAAWAEVARRLAHEIRNPLTPIQLSAERLKAKLAGKLAEAEAEVLERSTRTIVNQVAALKNMVDAFSQYARTPEPTHARARSQRADARGAHALRVIAGGGRAARARSGAAAGGGRRGATAAGHSQSAAERAGRAGGHARAARHRRERRSGRHGAAHSHRQWLRCFPRT